MSLYIPGCDLPKEGNKLLFIFPDGVVNEFEPGTPYYEAKQLPPHGDLVDRDELSKSLNRLCDRVCEYSESQRKTMCSACPLYSGIIVVEDDAPAIVEAEGSGTDES